MGSEWTMSSVGASAPNRSRYAATSSRRAVAPRLVITIREAAKRLGVSELTIRRRLDSGRINGVRIGGTWRIPGPAMDRILELPEACTVREIAQSLDVSTLTIRRWIAGGALPATMHDREWVISRSSLAAILRVDLGELHRRRAG